MNRRKRTTSPVPPAWRVRALLGLFALAAVALEARLAWLQLVQGEYLTAEGEERQLREVEIPVNRGLITDRYGEPLAVSTPVDSVFVDPQRFPVDRDSIYALARATGRDGEELEREITSNRDRQFLWVERGMSPAEAARVLDIGFAGVGIRREYKRFSPAHEVTCHLVGITNIDDVGTQGLEVVYDHLLGGVPGRKLVQRDERGRVIGDIEQLEAARPGRDLRTSIDLRLQYSAYFELKKAVQDSRAASGSFVMLDVVTGEVLAMVNQPHCNPNDEAQRQDLASFRNRAITDPVEPGSTIKPLVLAAALASGYTPDTRINVPKELVVGGRSVTSDENRLGIVSVTEILARSSSVGMGIIARELDAALMWQTFRAFGIAGSTESGLGRHESHGSLEGYAEWRETRKANLSFGYGLTVTPLQLARAYAAIGNGGLLPPVSFEALEAPPEHQRAISADIAADLMQMLEVVVSDQGTAQRAAIPNYGVAGKTGTARIHESGGGYSIDRYRAFFAGIAPASAPRFVAVVVINDPRGAQYYGGDVAAPVFAAVIGKALRMYGVAPDAIPEHGSMLISRAAVE
jgi:cell division protein FtsI (penicillin-binding protein 3)